MQRQLGQRAMVLLPPLGALLVGLTTSAHQMLAMGSVITLLLFVLAGLAWYGSDFVLIALLVAGYFAGWMKLRFSSWTGYALPDAFCILLLAHAFYRRVRTRLPLPRNGLTIGVLALTGYCLLEFLNPEAPLLRSLAGFRSWMLYTWLIFAGYGMLQSSRQLKQIYGVILSLSIVTALYGVYQWHAGPSALVGQNATLDFFAERWAWGGGGEGETRVFRAFSTFVMPASFGTNMALGLLIALVMIGARGISRGARYLAIAGTPLMAAGLAASGSRGPLVILVLGVAVISVLRKGKKTGLVLLLAVSAAWGATSLTTSLIGLRFSTLLNVPYVNGRWMKPLQYGLTIATQHPLGMGLGYAAGMPVLGSVSSANSVSPNNYSPGSLFHGIQTTDVDSGIGIAAAELGFAGMLMFIFLLLQTAICPLRDWRRLPDGQLKDLLLAPVSFSLVFALTAVVSPMNASLPHSIYFWLLIGMTFKAPYLCSAQAEVPSVIAAKVFPAPCPQVVTLPESS
jgi:hypothetical protein